MNISKSIHITFMYTCAFLSVAICPQVLAHDKLKTFDSLFGFKAGEDQAKIKLTKSSLDDRYFRARKPFRKFRDVQLTYNDNGKLRGITAVAWIDSMKNFAAVKKEVEACCKEFSVFGITFREKQENDPEFSAYGRGPGIEGMDIRGSVGQRYDERGRARVGASLTIEFNWNLDFKPINVKVANYSTKFGISRKEFIEKTFGMKFGEAIVKYIELNNEDRERLSENGKYNLYYVYRYMSSPICGFNGVCVYLDNKDNMRIKGIGFDNRVQVKDMAAAKARFENVRTALGKWLGIDSFDMKEDDKSLDSNKNESVSIVATFEDKGLRVKIRDFITENESAKQAGWSSSIDVSIEHITEAEARIAETEARMKKMVLPEVSFQPPDTIIDAIFFFNRTAKEIDRKNNVPEDKCGFHFVLDTKNDKHSAPRASLRLTMKDFSLWAALKASCDSARPRYKFEVLDNDNGAGPYILVTPAVK